jgi:hypothetical protein
VARRIVRFAWIYFAHYNFVRIHGSLRITPAMAANVTDHVNLSCVFDWSGQRDFSGKANRGNYRPKFLNIVEAVKAGLAG